MTIIFWIIVAAIGLAGVALAIKRTKRPRLDSPPTTGLAKPQPEIPVLDDTPQAVVTFESEADFKSPAQDQIGNSTGVAAPEPDDAGISPDLAVESAEAVEAQEVIVLKAPAVILDSLTPDVTLAVENPPSRDAGPTQTGPDAELAIGTARVAVSAPSESIVPGEQQGLENLEDPSETRQRGDVPPALSCEGGQSGGREPGDKQPPLGSTVERPESIIIARPAVKKETVTQKHPPAAVVQEVVRRVPPKPKAAGPNPECEELARLAAESATGGNLPQAIELYEKCMALSRKVRDARTHATALLGLSRARSAAGDIRAALHLDRQYLALVRKADDVRAEALALGRLGVGCHKLGDMQAAIRYYKRQLKLVRELDDRAAEANVSVNIGLLFSYLAENKRAIGFFEKAIAISRQIKNRALESQALGALGVTYKNMGDTERAIELYETWLGIAGQLGDRAGEIKALGNLGVALYYQGKHERALELYDRMVEIARERLDRSSEARGLWNMSLSLNSLGDRNSAVAHAESALKLFEQIGDRNGYRVRRQIGAWRRST